MEDNQPRVDPSDWASRRKVAMNRARELRSRMKEADHNRGSSSDVSSLASRSEMQRQRRSRQLEATQRLLEGQNFTESSELSVGSKSYGDEGSRQTRTRREPSPKVYSDEQRNDGSAAHSIISKKQLGQIHRRYQNPKENNSLTSRQRHNDTLSRYSGADDDYMPTTNASKRVRSMDDFRSPPSDVVPAETIQNTLREMPPEGRGRGRGRGRPRPSGSGGTSSLSEHSRSSKSRPRFEVAKDQMVDSRSRSPSSKRIQSSSHGTEPRHESVDDDAVKETLQAYLRSLQVPGYKEGECEKLAVLRQGLVERRRKRQDRLQHEKGNDTSPARRKVVKNSKPRYNGTDATAAPDRSSRDISHSLEDLDPNDYTASDFKSKPKRPNNYHDSMASPARVKAQESDDRYIHKHEDISMDKSQVSYNHSHAVEDGDDEASVVDIKLIKCDCCNRSFAPKVYEKHFNSDGQPKCASTMEKKRPVFNSAKARIANNSNLNKDEQMQVLQENKKAMKELTRKQRGKGKKSKKSDKWRQESMAFRDAMRTNRLISKAEKEGKPAHYYL